MERPNRREGDRITRGLAEKGFRNPKHRKEKAKTEKTSHNVCSRQLMDDANRLKCSKYQWK